MSFNDDEKKFKLVLAAIRTSDYSFPILLDLCKLHNINPDHLKPKKIEDFFDKKSCSEIHQLRFSHYESRRKTQLDFIAKQILNLNLNIFDLKSKKLSELYQLTQTQQRHSLNFHSLANQERQSLQIPISPRTSQIEIQHKKLSKAIKYLSNIQTVRSSEEQRKIDILLAKEQKFERIKREKELQAQKRQQKFSILKEKRDKNSRKATETSEFSQGLNDQDPNDFTKLNSSRFKFRNSKMSSEYRKNEE